MNMNISPRFVRNAILAVATIALLAPSLSHANGRHYHGSRIGVGINLNLFSGFYHRPYYAAGYYGYPYYYREVVVNPVVVTNPQPTVVYVESSPSNYPSAPSNQISNTPPVQSENVWYYCHNPDGFYPSIKSCPAGWQKVPARPPEK